MVSMLSYYERTSNGFLITIVTLAIIEIISRPWTTKSSKYSVKLETSYDQFGEIISSLKVSCNCVKGGLSIADSPALSSLTNEKTAAVKSKKISGKPNHLPFMTISNKSMSIKCWFF